MKEKIYLIVGFGLFTSGACMIHIGLGVIILGALFLFASYEEFKKKNE